MTPTSSFSLSIGTAMYERAPPNLDALVGTSCAASSLMWITFFVFIALSTPLPAVGRNRPRCCRKSVRAGGVLMVAAGQNQPSSYRKCTPYFASHSRVALAMLVTYIGLSARGQSELTR